MPDVLLFLSEFTLVRTLETAELWESSQKDRGEWSWKSTAFYMWTEEEVWIIPVPHYDLLKTQMGKKRISQEKCSELSLASLTWEEEEQWAGVSHLCGRGFPLSLLCGLHHLPLQLLPKLEQSLQLSAFGNYRRRASSSSLLSVSTLWSDPVSASLHREGFMSDGRRVWLEWPASIMKYKVYLTALVSNCDYLSSLSRCSSFCSPFPAGGVSWHLFWFWFCWSRAT